jgi:hypothetical protein
VELSLPISRLLSFVVLAFATLGLSPTGLKRVVWTRPGLLPGPGPHPSEGRARIDQVQAEVQVEEAVKVQVEVQVPCARTRREINEEGRDANAVGTRPKSQRLSPLRLTPGGFRGKGSPVMERVDTWLEPPHNPDAGSTGSTC